MPVEPRAEPNVLQDLGDGLVLRRSRSEDGERLAEFHANTLLDVHEVAPLERLYYWILDLMSGKHPGFNPGDFTLVEDTATGKIISSMALISQTWTYEGVPFRFGQPDIVSTDPAYRRRGLVRAQMDEVHRWSAARGELVQGITGIPWYYRQFGYEMALSLDANRLIYAARVPQLNDGGPEPFTLRPATMADIPFIMKMYRQATSRSVIAAPRDEAIWRFEIDGRGEKSGARRELRLIEPASVSGDPAGVLIHSRKLWGSGELGVHLNEVKPGVPFLAATPSILRYLNATGQEYATRDVEDWGAISFYLGERHPVYETVPERLTQSRLPYAWYLRVPDLPAFVRQIIPALEARLASSAQAGYSGELRISFYRDGLRFGFENGGISVDRWKPDRVEAGDAAFPDLTFLQLLFGYRSLTELRQSFTDCWVGSDAAHALLPVLFPKKDSNVWSGG